MVLKTFDSIASEEPYQYSEISPYVEDYHYSLKDGARRDAARFASVIGIGKSFVLMEEAPGVSLLDLMKEFDIYARKPDTYGLNPVETIKKLKWHFTRIGRLIANFHLKYGELNPETQEFKSVTHGDLHLNNIFYSKISNQITFIDYATASFAGEVNDITIDIHKISMKWLVGNSEYSNAIFYKYFRIGYINAFLENGMVCDFPEDYIHYGHEGDYRVRVSNIE